MNVATGGPEDTDAVLAMYEWLFEPPGAVPPGWDPAAGRKRLAEIIAGDDTDILVATPFAGGAPAGFCSVAIDLLSVRYGLRCWVEDLAVDPARRSRGIGSALLAAAREWAGARDASHLQLVSADARTDAHRFYEREGGGYRAASFVWRLA